jgi:hypothetical protein
MRAEAAPSDAVGMGDYDEIKPKLNFGTDIDYYETTDFGLISADVDNDAWIGTGDVMLTLSLHRSDGLMEQVHLPVQVDNGPVTRGARVTFPVENVTRQVSGETQLNLLELSGGEPTGASEWSVFYAPIRNPFESE